MINNTTEKLQGKALELIGLEINNIAEKTELKLIMKCEDKIYSVDFFNVSRIKLDGFSAPMIIEGFEIRENKNTGWDIDWFIMSMTTKMKASAFIARITA